MPTTLIRYTCRVCGGALAPISENNYVSGNIYEGDWVNDVRHGKGTFTYANGQTKTGYWQNDTFIG